MEYAIIIIVLTIVFFLIGREIVCWYFKINKSIELQRETNSLLKLMLQNKDTNRFKLLKSGDIFILKDEVNKHEFKVK